MKEFVNAISAMKVLIVQLKFVLTIVLLMANVFITIVSATLAIQAKIVQQVYFILTKIYVFFLQNYV